jgi:hypothetical protein
MSQKLTSVEYTVDSVARTAVAKAKTEIMENCILNNGFGFGVCLEKARWCLEGWVAEERFLIVGFL